ncbi:hypothetical protein Tco_0610815 [Tanacetum coccineum]
MRKALQEIPQRAFPSNTIPNPQEEIKAITIRSGNVLAGPSVPCPHSSSSSKEVERDPETITDQILPPLKLIRMFKKLHFNISLAEALALMPKVTDDDLLTLVHKKEWEKLYYGDLFIINHVLMKWKSENEKDKDLEIKCLINDMDDDFFPLLPISDSTLPEESSEIATLLSSPFENKEKVFNPDILILGGTQIFHEESKDKDLKMNSSTEALEFDPII